MPVPSDDQGPTEGKGGTLVPIPGHLPTGRPAGALGGQLVGEVIDGRTLPVPAGLAPDRLRDPYATYLGKLKSPESKRTMTAALETVARLVSGVEPRRPRVRRPADDREFAPTFPWHLMRHGDAARVREALVARKAEPATVNKILAALRGVVRAAWLLELVSAEAYQRVAAVEGVSGSRLQAGRSLPRGELRDLTDACAADATPAGARDAAILAVLYGAGLRRDEAARLTCADYTLATGALRIRGKGDKERETYVRGGAQAALEAWLGHRGDEPGPVFLAVNKAKRIVRARQKDGTLRGLSAQAMRDALARRALAAAVPHFTPHDCRRSFAGDLLDAGADIALVQQLMGHASPRTTSNYDRRPKEARRRAVGLIDFPFR